MSVKRNQISRTSSLGDIALSGIASSSTSRCANRSAVSAIDSKPSVANQPRERILTLGSPLNEPIEDNLEAWFDCNEVGSFLRRCFRCNKKIGPEDEVFMYRYLYAFCSPECRDKQIALDKELGRSSD